MQGLGALTILNSGKDGKSGRAQNKTMQRGGWGADTKTSLKIKEFLPNFILLLLYIVDYLYINLG